jgi:2',3'-cyclic-nucleotide 2'-phosphodiesterase (5'-nucleotidase family)
MAKHTTEGYEKIVVDAGDFASAGSKHGEFKSEWMIRAMGDLNYDAVAVGERDLQLGREKLLELADQHSLPLVCANLIDTESNELLVDPYKIVEKGSKSMLGLFGKTVKVGIFGILSPRYLVPVHKPGEAPLKATDPVEAAKATIEELQAKGCTVIIALVHVSVPEAGKIAGLGGLTAMVMGHSMSHLAQPRFDSGAIVIQGGREGRHIGDVKIEVGGDGKVVLVEGEVNSLSSTYKDDPHFAAIISEYKKALELRSFAPQVESTEERFIGKTTCGSCHTDQMDQWKTTQHADAFATLVEDNSHFDPECIICHVVGYGQANGFRDAKTTPAMADVQCESCHGSGMVHFRFHSSGGKRGPEADATMGTVAETVCTQCHKGDHDPEFDFEEKVKAVIH